MYFFFKLFLENKIGVLQFSKSRQMRYPLVYSMEYDGNRAIYRFLQHFPQFTFFRIKLNISTNACLFTFS